MNSIVDPSDPDYCETCSGECVAQCSRAYLVTALRSTVYRVHAGSKEQAIDKLLDSGEDAEEVDETTMEITAEVEEE